MIIELLVLLVAVAIGWSYSIKRIKNFPPGPLGLPVLGHLPFLGKEPHKTLLAWRKNYGPIIGIWFGSYRTVVINDTKLIREAMNMNAFSGRPRLNFFKSRSKDGIERGIVLTDGHQWTEQRRFTLKNLRDFGFGTKTMESKIQNEIQELLRRFKAKEGQPIQAKNVFDSAVINALWSIMFGERMEQEDPQSVEAFRSLATTIDEASLAGSLAIFLPWIAKIAPKLSGFEKMIRGVPVIKRFLRKQIAIHNEHYVENQPRDFVDAFMDEVKKTKDPNSSFHEKNNVMLYTLFDLFGAGSETTSTTLSWLCAYLIHNTQVQKKLQAEIDEVIGNQRQPALTDRPSMPYTEAVINEVMRFSNMLPFAIMHSTTEDVEFHGYFIPKDTMVIPNIYSAHFDEANWDEPHTFRPERFINSDGKFKKNENLLPFSTGKRVCIGESLARDELFLFTTSLFQTFSASAGGKLPCLEPNMGFTLSPQAFEMILTKRL